MQNKYVGDIGDFGKYGLLRALCGFRDADDRRELPLGIVWYLNPDDNKPGGDQIKYRKQPDRFRRCDPLLFHTLFWIVEANRRKVARIADSEIFPSNTVFFEDNEDNVPGELERRKQWLNRALSDTAACDLVFFDPDIGLAISLKPRITLKGWPLAKGRVSGEHVYQDEISPFLERGQSLVVIHHAAPAETVDQQVETLLDKLSDIAKGIEDSGRPFALRYHRGPRPRVFFVIPAKRDQAILLSRAEQLTQGVWSGHFSLVDPESI